MLECSVVQESNENPDCQTWVSTMGVDTSEANLWTTCRIRQVVNNKYWLYMPNTCENCTLRPSRDLLNIFGTSDNKELLKNIGLRMLKSCHDQGS